MNIRLVYFWNGRGEGAARQYARNGAARGRERTLKGRAAPPPVLCFGGLEPVHGDLGLKMNSSTITVFRLKKRPGGQRERCSLLTPG